MMARPMRFAYGCLYFVVALASACSGPRTYYVRNVNASVVWGLRPVGRRSIAEPTSGSYYFFFHGANLTMVDHFERASKELQRQRLLYIESDRAGKLLRTVKDEELVRGAYGALYVVKTCFYNKAVQDYQSGVSVGAYVSTLEHEVPSVLARMPAAAPQLTAFSLVRIYTSDPGYEVISGNYEANGKLGSLHVSYTKNGEWISGERSRIDLDKPDPRLKKYAIPLAIDLAQYVRSRRLPPGGIEQSEVVTLVYRHYGFGNLFQEDTLNRDVVTSSRVLQPSVTDEERTLDAACESRFLQQRSMGLPTVD